VFRAEELSSAAPCAIKVAKPEVMGAAARLAREAAFREELRHPGLPELLDWGHVGATSFLVFFWIEGVTLRGLLERQRGLPLVRTLDLLHDIAEVVAWLHAAGVAHGDLRADNLLVNGGPGRPRAVVSDLDSACRRGEPGWEATAAEDARRLAVLLCQMLTGVPSGQECHGLSVARGHHPGAVRLWESGSRGELSASVFLQELAALKAKIHHPLR
jgi:serine/threonine protein kinase